MRRDAVSYDDERGDGLVDPFVLLEEVAGDEAEAEHRREHANGHHGAAAPPRRRRHHQLVPQRGSRHVPGAYAELASIWLRITAAALSALFFAASVVCTYALRDAQQQG